VYEDVAAGSVLCRQDLRREGADCNPNWYPYLEFRVLEFMKAALKNGLAARLNRVKTQRRQCHPSGAIAASERAMQFRKRPFSGIAALATISF
jgi:hypothetical protein